MICPKCRAAVDDDLVFCTNCGERLYEPADESAPTIAMRDSVVTQIAAPRPQKSSPLKWLALGSVLLVLAAGSVIAYFSLKNPSPTTASVSNPISVNRRIETNAPRKSVNAAPDNKSSDTSNANDANINDANTNGENANAAKSKIVFDEQIEIPKGEHIAYPFSIETDAKIVGKLETLRGDETRGFVFTQAAYDEHFPDATFKTFSFDGKNPEIEQLLVKGYYVLIFVNETESSNVVKGKIEIEPNE